MSNHFDATIADETFDTFDDATSPQDLANHISKTTSDLIDLLNLETNHLRDNKFGEMGGMVEQKEILTSRLARMTKRFKHVAQSSAPADKEQLLRLQQSQLALRDAVAMNKEAINTLETVSKRLLSMIAEQNGGKKASTKVYDGRGTLTNSVKNAPKFVQINQNF